jgi:RecB family exonuclease
MTRAKSRLRLSWARHYEGSRSWRPSRFLAEMAVARGAVVDSGEAGFPAPSSNGHAPPPAVADPADGEPPTLSFSGIAAYRECPRQFWFRSLLRLPASPSIEAELGTAVHRSLMAVGELRRQGKEPGPGTLRRVYRRAWAESRFADERRRPALEALGWAQLSAFVAAGGLDSTPHLVEHAFTADLDGWRLRGIIDRVDPPPSQEGGVVGLEAVVSGSHRDEAGSRAASGARGHPPGPAVNGGASEPAASGAPQRAQRAAWRLIDYKTGTPVPAGRLRRDLQLSLYALGARQALGLDPIELEIVYLKTGAHLLLPADEELLAEARRIGGEVAAGVRARKFEARPERRRCQLCPYRLACDEAL